MTVRELLSNESKWTHGTFARNKDGIGTGSCSPEACRWCVIGAINRVYGYKSQEGNLAYAKIVSIVGPDVSHWNDHATWEEVDRVLTKAGI